MMMLTRRIQLGLAVLMASLLCAATAADPNLPGYKTGDLAGEDIICPVTVRVINPELTEAVKRKRGAEVPLVFRQISTAADEAETELRISMEAARRTFLTAFAEALAGRKPQASDIDSLAYKDAIRATALAQPDGPPIARFARIWLSGTADASIVETLIQPVRDVMAQPIADDGEWGLLSEDQSIRLIQVKSLTAMPGLSDLENAGVNTTAAHLSNLEMARSVVGSYFSQDQDEMAQFAAKFIRANTFPAPGLTELLRSRRRDEAIVYDTYAAGQVIVKKGQVIDTKALAMLAAIHEKQLIEALVSKAEPKQSSAGPVMSDAWKFGMWVGAAGLALLLILWRWGGSRRRDRVAVPEQPVTDAALIATNAEVENWRTRALLAEQRAERAHEAIRQGAVGWMREKLFSSIFRQRADLLATQQLAEAEMVELERRMERLLVPLQERIRTYEDRIKELEETLAVHEGADRQLIDARISLARHQLELERARVGQDY